MIITTAHARAVVKNGYCAKGMREFAARNNLDYLRFAREGLPEEELLKTGDAMALKVVAYARSLAESGNGQ